jgi:predicted transcriptional regulator
MSASNAQLTKNQLIKVLRGSDTTLKTKALQAKVKHLKGMLLSESEDTIRLIIERLVDLGALTVRPKFTKYGKVEYL